MANDKDKSERLIPDSERIVLPAERARAGSISGRVLTVLIVSLFLIVVAFGSILLYYYSFPSPAPPPKI